MMRKTVFLKVMVISVCAIYLVCCSFDLDANIKVIILNLCVFFQQDPETFNSCPKPVWIIDPLPVQCCNLAEVRV